MVIKYISLVFSAIFEIYYADLFFKTFAKPKYKKSVHALVLAVILALQIVNSMVNTQLILFGFAIVITAALSVFYTGKPYINTLLSLVLSVLNAISELITSGLVMLALGNEYTKVAENEFAYAVTVFTSKFLTLVIILIIRAFKTKFKNLSLAKGNMVLLTFLPVTTVFLMLLMCKMIFAANNMQLNTMFVVASILLYFANIATIELLTRQADLTRNQIELDFVKSSLAEQKKHYADISASQEQIKRINHDLKNFYISSIAQIESGNADSVVDKMKKELDIIDADKALIDTGHPAIDTIFENKIAAANSYGITCDIKFKYQADILIDDMDISIVVGNIMDNAIEACQAFDGEKLIEGYIHSNESDVAIKIANSSANSDGLKTKKSDKRFHGYGTKSIESIAEKYSGSAKFTSENNRFNTLVILTNH